MVKLINLRKKLPALQNGGMEIIYTGNPHLFGYIRAYSNQKILIVNNFSETPQAMVAHLQACGVHRDAVNLLNDIIFPLGSNLMLKGHQMVWLDISQLI